MAKKEAQSTDKVNNGFGTKGLSENQGTHGTPAKFQGTDAFEGKKKQDKKTGAR